ncbi:MAG: hypothetical protein HY859_14190 [Caulobacterales bacterium]|nr:hypothetical protein [Caulobacterales bacterium]
MGKYGPLTQFLAKASGTEIPMTFAEIEQVTGHPLPASKQYPAWWSNNPSNNVMTKAWLAAGFQTERVDIGGERLVFRRVADEVEPGAPAAPQPQPLEGTLLERIRARLGGMVTVSPGVDLTAPVSDIWDAER